MFYPVIRYIRIDLSIKSDIRDQKGLFYVRYNRNFGIT